MNNNYVSVNSTHNDHSNLNFLLQFTPNHVNPNTDLLNEMFLTEVVLWSTKKPRSVGPHKSILKENNKQWKSQQENKKFRSVYKSTIANHNVQYIEKSLRHLVYKSKDRNKCPHKNTSTLFPIIWKFTKQQFRIIPDHLPHHEHNHRVEPN